MCRVMCSKYLILIYTNIEQVAINGSIKSEVKIIHLMSDPEGNS